MTQFAQMRSGAYDDWHPPVMARLWSVYDAVGLHGTAPLFVLQTLLFYAGLALFAAALAPGRRGVALAALALLIPADWLTVIVKDAQMVAALTAASGLVAAYRLRGRTMPPVAVAAAAILLGYAVLVRANAVFAVVPLACAWLDWGGVRPVLGRIALMLAAAAAVLAVNPLINNRLLDAVPTQVERVLMIYDLAGIAHFGGTASVPRLPVAIWREAERRDCYDPYLWDAYGDAARCGFVADAAGLGSDAGRTLPGEWLGAIVRHPLAYAAHRLAQFNATLRFVVPFGQPNAAAPPDSQPNDLGLGRRADRPLRAVAATVRGVAATPLGWPAVWLAAASGLAWTAAATPRGPARDTALALLLSAALMPASFAAVGIAADLRYHLWAIVATVLGGGALATCRPLPRRPLALTAAAVGIVAVIGIVARLTLAAGAW